MGEPIVNKVAKSPLINFDLEEWIPKGQRTLVDLSKWLEDGFLLREKPFREALKQEDWSIYQDHYIAINCSTDAILPATSCDLSISCILATDCVCRSNGFNPRGLCATKSVFGLTLALNSGSSCSGKKPLV